MGEHVFKVIELAGTSTNSVQEATLNAIARAAQTLRHLQWFEVVETRGRIEDGKIAQWQVVLKVGMALEPVPPSSSTGSAD